MTDREKVIKGVQYCLDYYDSQCEKCPYQATEGEKKHFDWDCHKDDLQRDALKLLKDQEARVLTLDELTGIYVEFKGDACPLRLSNFDLQKIIMYTSDGECRLWTGKPTDKQRETVKWDD